MKKNIKNTAIIERVIVREKADEKTGDYNAYKALNKLATYIILKPLKAQAELPGAPNDVSESTF
ncbi:MULTISPECIES: hypothetical protein [unclassified Polaribacter]|uniref:hypothetical protein n=1 Tax=unclassified Polaribacter TaxID=196858 RepID=UPI0011BE32DA|nr:MULTISPECIES: hypothetical protein [unclassified Polaribacter]TXD50853.1 hypothetical protein ES043_14370 [Polaribacter sp. IC063]TXD57678.1 hypothetical protein ES044_14375 [Polaribacter sp. IC066]